MFWNLYRNEIAKLFRHMLYWAGLAMLLGFCALIFGLLYAAAQIPPENFPASIRIGGDVDFQQVLTWPGAFYAAMNFCGASSLGGLLAILLAGALTAQEYSWRTLNLAVSHGASRIGLLAVKGLSYFTAVLGWVLIPTLVVGAAALFTGRQIFGAVDVSAVDPIHLGLSILRETYALFPYIAMAFCFALATRSAVAAIGLTAGYSLILEGLLIRILSLMGGAAAKAAACLPGPMTTALLQANQPGASVGGGGTMDPTAAAAAIAVFTCVFFLVSIRVFRRQDLTS